MLTTTFATAEMRDAGIELRWEEGSHYIEIGTVDPINGEFAAADIAVNLYDYAAGKARKPRASDFRSAAKEVHRDYLR